MDSAKLKALQAPLKTEYREDPSLAKVTLLAKGRLGDENITCKVETGKKMVEAGLHPKTGGDGFSLCSGDMLLEALVACAGVTLKRIFALYLNLPRMPLKNSFCKEDRKWKKKIFLRMDQGIFQDLGYQGRAIMDFHFMINIF